MGSEMTCFATGPQEGQTMNPKTEPLSQDTCAEQKKSSHYRKKIIKQPSLSCWPSTQEKEGRAGIALAQATFSALSPPSLLEGSLGITLGFAAALRREAFPST